MRYGPASSLFLQISASVMQNVFSISPLRMKPSYALAQSKIQIRCSWLHTNKPNKNELAQLAESADSPFMRSRYARILSQLELQMPD